MLGYFDPKLANDIAISIDPAVVSTHAISVGSGPDTCAKVDGNINTPDPIILPHTSIVAINKLISFFKFLFSIFSP